MTDESAEMINELQNGSFHSLAFPPFIRMYPLHHVLDLVLYRAFHCFSPFLRLDVFPVSWSFLHLLPKIDTHNLLLHRLLIFGCVYQFIYILEVEKLSIIAIANYANNINADRPVRKPALKTRNFAISHLK
jgi:hypothetical protein